jgi:hypothetical protein
VILIISRNEYITSGIAPHLWYEDADYANFKSSALKEYQDLMKDGNMNKQDALKELYQPKLSDNNSSSRFNYYNICIYNFFFRNCFFCLQF